MPVSFAALSGIDLRRYQNCMQQWAKISDRLSVDVARYENSVSKPVNDGTWTGPASVTGRKSVQDSQIRLVATQQYADGVRALLLAAALGFAHAKNRYLQAALLADSAGIPVNGDGLITPDFVLTTPVADWDNPPILVGMTAQSMIYQALRMADAVDETLAPMLGYANKFGTSDDGPWLADAAVDHQNALVWPQDIQDTVDAVAVDLPPWHDTPAQPYKVRGWGAGDLAFYEACQNAGVPYLLVTKGVHASMLFSHFLDNTGTPVPADPQHIMNDVPKFRNLVYDALLTQGNYAFDTGWTNTDVEDDTTGIAQSEDWYYALNDFRYRVTGRGYVSGDQQVVDYSVGLLKPYVFGQSGGLFRKPIHLPLGITIDQQQLANLHTTGLAQNFIVQGVTHFRTTYSLSGGFSPTTTVTRADPWPTL
jgi:hypothetical protein